MKNKIIATILAATVFLALCGCKNNNNDDIAPYVASDKWEKVEKADMPARVDATLTFEKMEELYRPHTDWRIYDIRTTETTVKPTNGGTAYYVSNKGNETLESLIDSIISGMLKKMPKNHLMEKVKDIFDVEHFKKVVITQKEEGLVYVVTLSTDHEYMSEALCQILKDNKFILSAERCYEE